MVSYSPIINRMAYETVLSAMLKSDSIKHEGIAILDITQLCL